MPRHAAARRPTATIRRSERTLGLPAEVCALPARKRRARSAAPPPAALAPAALPPPPPSPKQEEPAVDEYVSKPLPPTIDEVEDIKKDLDELSGVVLEFIDDLFNKALANKSQEQLAVDKLNKQSMYSLVDNVDTGVCELYQIAV